MDHLRPVLTRTLIKKEFPSFVRAHPELIPALGTPIWGNGSESILELVCGLEMSVKSFRHVVHFCLHHGVDISCFDGEPYLTILVKKYTPLRWSAHRKFVQRRILPKMYTLLACGVDPNIATPGHNPPLLEAILRDNPRMVMCLLHASASPDLRLRDSSLLKCALEQTSEFNVSLMTRVCQKSSAIDWIEVAARQYPFELQFVIPQEITTTTALSLISIAAYTDLAILLNLVRKVDVGTDITLKGAICRYWARANLFDMQGASTLTMLPPDLITHISSFLIGQRWVQKVSFKALDLVPPK